MNFSLCTLTEIASEYILSKGESQDELLRYSSILYRGLTFLNQQFVKQTKRAEVSKNSVGIINYPDDCISLVRLSADYNGIEYPIYNNDKLATFVKEECAVEEPFTDPPLTDFYEYYDFSSVFAGIKYKDDKDGRRIRLTGTLPESATLVLTYVWNGLEDDRETYVLRAYYELLRAWLDWQLNNRDPYLKQNFADQLTIARAFKFRQTKDEMDAYFRSIKSRI